MKNIYTKAYLLLIFLFATSYISFGQTTLETSLNLVEIGGVSVPYQNGMPLPTFEKQNSRTIIDLAGEWKKLRFATIDNISLAKRDAAGLAALETEAAGKQLASFNDAAWEKKTLPGVENALTEATAPNGLFPEIYNDGVWYRRTFTVDAANSGKFAKLMFYSVNYVCDVWINGIYIGYHEGGYTPFAFDVSNWLNFGATNTIAIRVDNIAWGSRKDIIPVSSVDWFNWAGVIHDVYLELSDPVSVVRANVIPKDVDGNIETTIIMSNKNESASSVSVSVKVYEANITQSNIQSEFVKDLAGSEVTLGGTTQSSLSVAAGASSVWKTNLKISNPKLWTMKTPNLYVMKVTLLNGTTVLDEYYTQFGVRIVEAKQGKFLLNNRIMFLPGVARHEEHPDYGRSVPKNIIYSDLVTIKGLNATYLRTAHYPNHLYTYLIADRLGLAIMEEIPVWQWDTQAVWDLNNTRKLHQQMFREMVFKDYNRPSVVMWSTSNECHLDGGGRLIYHNTLKSDYRTNYNDGRLLTQSAAADKPGAADATQEPLDVAGWTIYYGIFYGTSKNYFGPTYNFVNDAKKAFPNKPLIDTEFGYWSSENGSSEAEQVKVLTETFNGFKLHFPYDASGAYNEAGNLMGVTWWCVFDWYQYKPKKQGWQTMGLISMDRKTEKQVANNLRTTYFPFANKDGIVVGIEKDSKEIPAQFSLEQNYPNPFNPETTISYKIQAASNVSLKVYDLLGREIATLVNEFKQAGSYNSQFLASRDASRSGSILNSQLPSGIYFYRLQAGSFVQTKKMLLIK
ncbi:MAG: glycoside hydrolase family 2 TIM barrel-domain containing protein [Ignavibacteria bacterium]|nr:glycoside hydrolase family 2 TIM barrel-domain containing protein [Ignavibacteria bacterium]